MSGGAGGTSGERDASGGIFGVSKGLIFEFGENRVIDTPISESAIIGAGSGAASAVGKGAGAYAAGFGVASTVAVAADAWKG